MIYASSVVKTDKLPIQRHLVQHFFGRRVQLTELLLKVVGAQHCLYRKREDSRLPFGAYGAISITRSACGTIRYLVPEFARSYTLGRQI